MNSPTYHPSKSYIKAMIPFSEIETELTDDIVIPYFIDYSSAYPFILFIFQKNEDDKLDFIRNDPSNNEDNKTYLDNLFCSFHSDNSTLFHRHSCFYELSHTNKMDMSGLLCNNNTLLWFSTPYEIYNLKSLYTYSFEDEVLSFFNSNPCLNQLMWNNNITPSPIIAYSIDTLRKSKFHSTFGSEKREVEPHYSLYNYQSIYSLMNLPSFTDNDTGIVRYVLFEPFLVLKENIQSLSPNVGKNNRDEGEDKDKDKGIIYSFSNYLQHTPLCYFKK